MGEFVKAGGLVVGCQIGNVEGKKIYGGTWRHDLASMKRLWKVIGEETGTAWRTQAWLRSWKEMGWDEKDQKWLVEGARVIEFVVERVE